MRVPVELKITYDGAEPGLAEHRLSLSAFAEPLKLLLAALQRTASGIVSQALEDPTYGSRGGQLAADAKLLDLELVSVAEGSACPTFVCTTRPSTGARAPHPTLPGMELGTLQRDLAADALRKLLGDIDAERSGHLRNFTARKYLQSIPRGVTRQRYTATSDGEILADVEFSAAMLPTTPQPLPRLTKITGTIASLGFEAGVTFIGLKTDARSLKCTATPEQVEAAVMLRAGRVVAAVLISGEKLTVVWLQSANASSDPPPLNETLRHLREDWSETLARLAR